MLLTVDLFLEGTNAYYKRASKRNLLYLCMIQCSQTYFISEHFFILSTFCGILFGKHFQEGEPLSTTQLSNHQEGCH